MTGGGPAPPRPTVWLSLRVGLLDRAIAALLGVVLGPLVGVLAVWVRLREGPPSLLRLTRAGRHGRPFGMWKVRTMSATDDGGRAGGPVITAGGDIRITASGRWMRRHRLDELPQLANVLTGDMALIGARPEEPTLVDADSPAWADVLCVPPAITGATQLVVHEWEEAVMHGACDHVGRYRTDVLPVKLAIDRWYVHRSSPALDVVIAWSMVERFVLGRRTTVIDRRVRSELPELVAALDGVTP